MAHRILLQVLVAVLTETATQQLMESVAVLYFAVALAVLQ